MLKRLLFILILAISFSLSSETLHAQSAPYKFAAGLRVPWGVGLTAKYFLKETAALEGIVQYRSFGVPGFDYSWVRITGLYEVQKDLNEVTENLDWYFGGGASIAFYGGDWDYPGSDFSSTIFGINGVIGLEYVFENAPVSISLDWMPAVYFNGGGFNGEGGLLGVRYIFTE